MNDEIRKNIAELPFNYTTYVVMAILWAADWWMGLPADRQQYYLTAYPWLQDLAMPASALVFFAAKVLPQLGIKPIMPEQKPVLSRGAPIATDFAPTVPRLTTDEIDALLKADQIIKSRARGS